MSSETPKRPSENGSTDQPRVKRSRFDAAAPVVASHGPAVGAAAAADRAATLAKAQKALQLGSDIKSRIAALQVRIIWAAIRRLEFQC